MPPFVVSLSNHGRSSVGYLKPRPNDRPIQPPDNHPVRLPPPHPRLLLLGLALSGVPAQAAITASVMPASLTLLSVTVAGG